jgi:hypothetical protein
MKGYDPDFIENRIKWRAGQHNVPYPRTNFWQHAPESIRQHLPDSFVRPVLFSQDRQGNSTVIGTEELAVIEDGTAIRVLLDDIIDLSSPNIAEGKQKSHFCQLSVKTTSGDTLLPTEDGKGCFAVWNILLMLCRLRRK